MPLKIGIVGLPNAGKSTLFNALTESASAQAENFPFCTIEPNVGKAIVRDARLDKIAEVVKTKKTIYESVELVDIAGLVEGASKGEGLGNKFLSNIRECDAVLIMLRFFADENITHVLGNEDPSRDKEILEIELILKDLETAEKAVSKIGREAKSGNKEKQAELVVFQKLLTALENGKKANSVKLDEYEEEIAKTLHLLTNKPFLFVANTSEEELLIFDAESAKKKIGLAENEEILPISARIESEIAILDPEERKEFLESMNITESGLDKIARTAFKALNLISYFTAGEIEARAWAVERDSTAPQAAGKIHTDFEKGFIRADSVQCEDFIATGGWNGSKEQGKMQTVGKDHIVSDGEVLFFKFSS